MADQRRHKVWQRLGKIRSTRRWGHASGFPFSIFFWKASSTCCLYLCFSLSGTAFRGVGFYRNGRWELLRWVLGGGGPFILARPNPRSCLLLLSNPALFFLISKGKALIQLLVSLCAFHFSITGVSWSAGYDVKSLGYVALTSHLILLVGLR